MTKIAILILAAGNSTRMGEAKQLLPYGTKTLLEHTIAQAKNSVAEQVFCVLGANAETIEKIINNDLVFIHNKSWQDGLSSSIACGVEKVRLMGFDSILVMLADQPKIDTFYLNLLIETSVHYKTKCIASDYGTRNGVPAVFPKTYFEELLSLKGDQGAKNLLNATEEKVIALDAQDKIQDIDTPEDYARLLKK
ncbi:molybdenum cofactor cytidylyltransferase [Leeuwenhoekiella aestuarii]|uniref:Molybdenum cofactor cytidylyltransferase n=1 Tax=Leeuwenhoekiella aestuarii TaxID=2249426 RepID=A0A4Q0NW70_9FLAO|nr:nucleotidyltransferase family protein [Leeuwenhoekiella aestuarii]RXG15622.1 molybdenum cofactor cytidylyltransferase [Leeuwenhoekiella aestuarii]RXG17269.1 molybdenum cofactor cytidylyltransferase [Leeuwenhoekiella aestuarii]